jgi:beta-lactam-binding protein with PASTA domain
MKSFFRFLLLSLVLLMVALVSALTAMHFAIHGSEVAVPDFVGTPTAEVRRIAEGKGLEVTVESQYYSAKIPEGRIVSQSPAAGTKVRRGWQVRAAESLGPQRVEIPNVVGESLRVAEINLRRRGLQLSAVARMATRSLASLPGISDPVMAQDPPAHASGISAPKISLLIAAEPPSEAFVMPSFVGQQLGNATLALQKSGLRAGNVAQSNQAANPAGSAPLANPEPTSTIVSQDPQAGAKVLSGSPVNFILR